MIKVVQVDKIDDKKVYEIKSAHEDLSKSKDKDKILHLDLTDTTGNTELARYYGSYKEFVTSVLKLEAE